MYAYQKHDWRFIRLAWSENYLREVKGGSLGWTDCTRPHPSHRVDPMPIENIAVHTPMVQFGQQYHADGSMVPGSPVAPLRFIKPSAVGQYLVALIVRKVVEAMESQTSYSRGLTAGHGNFWLCYLINA